MKKTTILLTLLSLSIGLSGQAFYSHLYPFVKNQKTYSFTLMDINEDSELCSYNYNNREATETLKFSFDNIIPSYKVDIISSNGMNIKFLIRTKSTIELSPSDRNKGKIPRLKKGNIVGQGKINLYKTELLDKPIYKTDRKIVNKYLALIEYNLNREVKFAYQSGSNNTTFSRVAYVSL